MNRCSGPHYSTFEKINLRKELLLFGYFSINFIMAFRASEVFMIFFHHSSISEWRHLSDVQHPVCTASLWHNAMQVRLKDPSGSIYKNSSKNRAKLSQFLGQF